MDTSVREKGPAPFRFDESLITQSQVSQTLCTQNESMRSIADWFLILFASVLLTSYAVRI